MPHDAPIARVTPATPEDIARLMRAATYAAVVVAAFLIGVKLYAWSVTGSVSMLSTLVDSCLDAAASLINLFAVHHALKPADAEHRFGHGKAESLAGLGQAAFISGSALFLMLEAGDRLLNPQELARSELGMAVMVVSIVLTVCLVMFQRFVVRKTSSVAISADSLHYKTDILVNISVILALAATAYLDLPWVDPVFGMVIALYILWSAREIALEAINQLLDRELPQEDRQNILGIARQQPGVMRVHDLRTRASGINLFIQLHVVLDGQRTLHDAHVDGDRVMHAIEEAYPGAEVLIHLDPHDIDEPIAEFDG